MFSLLPVTMDSGRFGDSATHSWLARDDFKLEIADFEDDPETDSSGLYGEERNDDFLDDRIIIDFVVNFELNRQSCALKMKVRKINETF